jgi:formylglycine-generating enzyme required for sulfatase activity
MRKVTKLGCLALSLAVLFLFCNSLAVAEPRGHTTVSGKVHLSDKTDHGGGLAPLDAISRYARVPSGFYTMGDGTSWCGTDQHQVTLTRDFYLGRYEVTNQEYLNMVQWAYDNGYVTVTTSSVLDNLDGSTAVLVDLSSASCEIQFAGGVFSLRDAGHGINPTHPMKLVTWYGAVAYCDWLSMKAGYPRAYSHATWECNGGDPYGAVGYRLPTDAEWEYASQYNDGRMYSWGNEAPSCARANYRPGGVYCVGWTSPVGSYPPEKTIGGASLFDMAGNVLEWCNDWYVCNLGTDPVTDPPGPSTGSGRLFRGGGWGDGSGTSLACSMRYGSAWGPDPSTSYNDVGFRCARTTEENTAIGPETIPGAFQILSVSPNPFNPSTTVHFVLPEAMPVTAEIWSVNGARVKVLSNGQWFGPGNCRLTWDGRNDHGSTVSSGVYFIQVKTRLGAKVARAVLLR